MGRDAPAIHGADHLPWGPDPIPGILVETPDVSGFLHYGDNVPIFGSDDWLSIQTNGVDGSGFGLILYATAGNARLQADAGDITINAAGSGHAVVIEGADYTEVRINSSLPTYDAARKFKITLSGASMFEFWGDGTVHGRAAIGGITWDL